MYEVIMKGKTMISFIPLEKLPLARSPSLNKWIKGWDSTLWMKLEVLETAGWFEHVHNHDGIDMNMDVVWIPSFKAGTFVWSPAPVVSRIVIEELSQARQKRTQSVHVLGVPRLLWIE